MASHTKENYLKALHFLSQKDGSINLSDLSKEMGVSTPTANSMVKKLQERGWLVYQKYKPLKLTKEGKKTAAMVIRKHRLAEMFLVQIMGFGWEEVHEIAEEMEHIDSTALFSRMDELLGHPTVDPHGSPIPNPQGQIAYKDYVSLAEQPLGQWVRFCALQDSSDSLLRYLNKKKVALGTEMKVLHRESFDGSAELKLRNGKKTVLSETACSHLLTEEVPN